MQNNIKCSRCEKLLKSTDYFRSFRHRILCKDCYPKYLKYLSAYDAEKKLELELAKDSKFYKMFNSSLKNFKLILSLYKNNFDDKIADILISRKDEDGYFFERICEMYEQEHSDMLYDIRKIMSYEYSLVNIRKNLNERKYNEYRIEYEKQRSGELMIIFEQTVKLFANTIILYDRYSKTFADETFALREYIVKKSNEYIQDNSLSNIVVILRKIVSHLYELLFFIDYMNK